MYKNIEEFKNNEYATESLSLMFSPERLQQIENFCDYLGNYEIKSQAVTDPNTFEAVANGLSIIQNNKTYTFTESYTKIDMPINENNTTGILSIEFSLNYIKIMSGMNGSYRLVEHMPFDLINNFFINKNISEKIVNGKKFVLPLLPPR